MFVVFDIGEVIFKLFNCFIYCILYLGFKIIFFLENLLILNSLIILRVNLF